MLEGSINVNRSVASLTSKSQGYIYNQVSIDVRPKGKKAVSYPRCGRDVAPEQKGKPKG